MTTVKSDHYNYYYYLFVYIYVATVNACDFLPSFSFLFSTRSHGNRPFYSLLSCFIARGCGEDALRSLVMVFFVRVLGDCANGDVKVVRLLFSSRPTLHELASATERYFTNGTAAVQGDQRGRTPFLIETMLLFDEYKCEWVEFYSSGQLTTDCHVRAVNKRVSKMARERAVPHRGKVVGVPVTASSSGTSMDRCAPFSVLEEAQGTRILAE
uniref:Uncharacterized protein n=1 Tax=Trypanosoma congolense (strain IL3000) TaxID=1068625 RepID=G0USF1_TRYCI|nr:conserved hypothetical protein [Trypanosoma congolense IL3000]